MVLAGVGISLVEQRMLMVFVAPLAAMEEVSTGRRLAAAGLFMERGRGAQEVYSAIPVRPETRVLEGEFMEQAQSAFMRGTQIVKTGLLR